MTVLEEKKKSITARLMKRPARPSRSRPIPVAVVLPAATPVSLPPHVRAALRGIMVRDLCVNFGEGAALLLTAWPALWLFQALADWSFDLPWLVRLTFLGADVAVAGYLIFRFFVQPWRHRLTFQTAALRAETVIPTLRSGLISSVELAAGRRGSMQGSLPLVHELIARVSGQIKNMNLPQRVVKTVQLRRRANWAATVLFLGVLAAAFFWPKSEVLLQRILLSQVPLPTRTIVVAITRNESVAVGSDLTLSARAQGVIPKSGRLDVVYDNNDHQEIPAVATTDDPAIFVVAMKNVQQSFRYQFTLNDGTGQEFTVTAKVPPALASFRCLQDYPAYTGMAETEMEVGNLALFSGSRVRIEGRSTQPLSTATLRLQGTNQEIKMDITGDDKQGLRGEFTVPRDGLTGFSIQLVNANGVSSFDDTVYQVELVQDKPPVVKLSVPMAEQLSVLVRSKPRLVYSVSDDFGLRKVALKYELTRPTPPGGQPPAPESGEIALPVPMQGDSGTDLTYRWDLAAQRPSWSEGCTVTYWIEATDNNDATGPGITQSDKKMLSIVSEAAKKAEIIKELGDRATELEQTYESQQILNQDLDSTLRKTQP